MKNGKLSYVNILISVNDDGYMAQCPGVQGAFAEGDTIEKAVFNCIDVKEMIADYRKERSEKMLEDYEDLLDLRKAKRESENEPGMLIDDVMKKFNPD